jgi:hypothetical protein
MARQQRSTTFAPESTAPIARVALYARVSTLNNQDPEMQLAELREYAARRGWQVVEEFIDRGVSGCKESRPALNRLMSDLPPKLQRLAVALEKSHGTCERKERFAPRKETSRSYRERVSSPSRLSHRAVPHNGFGARLPRSSHQRAARPAMGRHQLARATVEEPSNGFFAGTGVPMDGTAIVGS